LYSRRAHKSRADLNLADFLLPLGTKSFDPTLIPGDTAPMGPDLAIEVRDLRRVFAQRQSSEDLVAVDAISFDVAAGERLAFIGPNGAGKSTSIKMLSGLLYPTSGTASVLGYTPWSQRKQLAFHIGSLFGQRSQLWTELPAQATFRLLGKVFGLSTSELNTRVNELGEALDAHELFQQRVDSLSLGQRMRCELAACLLHRPRLLFLDEPTIGLDLLAKNRFRELLVEINQNLATTILLTSHDVADVEQVAQRVIIVNHGRLIYDDQLAAMQQQLLTSKTIVLHLAEPASGIGLAALATPEVTLRRDTDHQITAVVDTSTVDIETVLLPLLRHLSVRDFTVSDPSLERVIGTLYQSGSSS